jgi:hypothetical protein
MTTIKDAIAKLCYYHSSLNVCPFLREDAIAFESLARLYLLINGKKEYFGENLNSKEKRILLLHCKKYFKKIKNIQDNVIKEINKRVNDDNN